MKKNIEQYWDRSKGNVKAVINLNFMPMVPKFFRAAAFAANVFGDIGEIGRAHI